MPLRRCTGLLVETRSLELGGRSAPSLPGVRESQRTWAAAEARPGLQSQVSPSWSLTACLGTPLTPQPTPVPCLPVSSPPAQHLGSLLVQITHGYVTSPSPPSLPLLWRPHAPSLSTNIEPGHPTEAEWHHIPPLLEAPPPGLPYTIVSRLAQRERRSPSESCGLCKFMSCDSGPWSLTATIYTCIYTSLPSNTSGWPQGLCTEHSLILEYSSIAPS